MFVDQLKMVQKVFFCTLILIGFTSLAVEAGPIINLDKHHPLGTIVKIETNGQSYFSLGNGRGIQFSSAITQNKKAIVPEILILQKSGNVGKVIPVKKKNLRW